MITKNKPRPTLCLIGMNSAWYQSNPALYYLRECVRGLAYNVQIMEFTLAESLFDVLSQIHRQKPDIACFSAYIWNGGQLRQLIPDLKKLLPDVKIVLGGPEAEHGEFGLGSSDYTVRGPGEGMFLKLAKSGFSLPGGVCEAPAPPLCELAFPYRRADKAALCGKLVYYETSRGCPFHCAYCLSALDNRNEARFDASSTSDRKRLYRELDLLLEMGPRTLKFVDRSFNVHPQLARLIWSYAISQGSGCEFHFEIYPDLLVAEDLLLLEQAPEGRIRFEVGIQTINTTVARACGRNSNWPKAKAILNTLRERTRICVHADLLAGLPGEKFNSVLHSLDELASTLPAEIQLGMLKILPDTPMREIARRRGYNWMEQPPWQVLATDALNFTEMVRLQELAKTINLYWNKGEFTLAWQQMLTEGHKASKLLLRLLQMHHRRDLPLHSVSKNTRAEIFSAL